MSLLVYNEIRKQIMHFAEGVIAGGIAGVIVETALYPIDTIKTRLQACQFYLVLSCSFVAFCCILLLTKIKLEKQPRCIMAKIISAKAVSTLCLHFFFFDK